MTKNTENLNITAFDAMRLDRELLRSIAGKVSSPLHELEKKIETLLAQQRHLEKALRAANLKEATNHAKTLLATAETVNGTPAIIAHVAFNATTVIGLLAGR